MAVLSENEFKMFSAEVKAMYPKQDFLRDQYAASIWYRNLNDIPYQVLRSAFDLHVQTSQFPPTPADIRKNSELIMTNTEDAFPTFEEVWAMIKEASTNSNYNAEETFSKLPKIVQDVIGTPQILSTFGVMEDEFDSVQKSHSLKAYTQLKSKMIRDARMSPKYTTALENAASIEKGNLLPGTSDVKAIEEKSAYKKAREAFENPPEHERPDDNYTNELFRRFGEKAPQKED